MLLGFCALEQIQDVQLPDATDRDTLVGDALELLDRYDLPSLRVLALVHYTIAALRYLFGYRVLFLQCGLLFHYSLER